MGAMLGALWLLLGRGEVVFSAVCLAEFMATSAASPASCGSRTVVSSRCRCPTGSRPGVSTYSEGCLFLFFSAFSLGLCRGHSARSRNLLLVCDRSGLFHTLYDPSCAVHTWRTGGVVPFPGRRCAVSSLPRVLFTVSPVFRVVSVACLLGSTRFQLLRRSVVALDDSVFHVQVYVEC